jgi:hypothetical protein
MGFRFYRRIRIAPGLTLNLGKRNASVSVGERGAHLTFGTKGNRATVGLPGTGMYYTRPFGRPRLVCRTAGWLGGRGNNRDCRPDSGGSLTKVETRASTTCVAP